MKTAEQYPAESDYEPYPGKSVEDFAREFLTEQPIRLRRFCEKEGIDPGLLPALVDDVLNDWALAHETHFDRRAALVHLINHLRIKINRQYQYGRKRNNAAGGSAASHAYADADTRMASIAEAVLRQSPGCDKQ